MEFSLSRDEARVLTQVLDNYLPQLRSEVYRTENYEWRQGLKEDEAVIKDLMRRLERLMSLEAGPPSSPAQP